MNCVLQKSSSSRVGATRKNRPCHLVPASRSLDVIVHPKSLDVVLEEEVAGYRTIPT
jgi:hypothetical protein